MKEISQISYMTYSETILLRSTLHAISNQEFICSTCLSKYKSRKDSAVMTEKNCALKACKEIRKAHLFKVRQERMTINYSTCIGNFFSHSATSWISMYNHFEKGVMGFEGAYMDQPNKFIEAMSVIQGHKNEQIILEQEKNKSKSRQVNRG